MLKVPGKPEVVLDCFLEKDLMLASGPPIQDLQFRVSEAHKFVIAVVGQRMLAMYRLVYKKALATFRVYRPVFLFLETEGLASEDL